MIGNVTQSGTDLQLEEINQKLSILFVNQSTSQPISQPPNNARQHHQNHHTNRNQHPAQIPNEEQMKTCRYCDSLAKNTNRSASEVASIITDITKRDFNITHSQFQVRHTGRWIIPPQGCLQWLHASMDDRIKSLGSKPSVCTVCLAAPGKCCQNNLRCFPQCQTKKRWPHQPALFGGKMSSLLLDLQRA